MTFISSIRSIKQLMCLNIGLEILTAIIKKYYFVTLSKSGGINHFWDLWSFFSKNIKTKKQKNVSLVKMDVLYNGSVSSSNQKQLKVRKALYFPTFSTGCNLSCSANFCKYYGEIGEGWDRRSAKKRDTNLMPPVKQQRKETKKFFNVEKQIYFGILKTKIKFYHILVTQSTPIHQQRKQNLTKHIKKVHFQFKLMFLLFSTCSASCLSSLRTHPI